MTNKQFAEKNAGRYFALTRYKVRVVGYYKGDDRSILVSVSPRAHNFGWSKEVMDEDDIMVIPPPKATKFRYVTESDLKEWKWK